MELDGKEPSQIQPVIDAVRYQHITPYVTVITDEIYKKVIAEAFQKIKQGTLTAEHALSLWHEIYVLEEISRKLTVKSKVPE